MNTRVEQLVGQRISMRRSRSWDPSCVSMEVNSGASAFPVGRGTISHPRLHTIHAPPFPPPSGGPGELEDLGTMQVSTAT